MDKLQKKEVELDLCSSNSFGRLSARKTSFSPGIPACDRPRLGFSCPISFFSSLIVSMSEEHGKADATASVLLYLNTLSTESFPECVCVFVCMCAHTYGRLYMWRPEDNLRGPSPCFGDRVSPLGPGAHLIGQASCLLSPGELPVGYPPSAGILSVQHLGQLLAGSWE